MQWDSTAQMKNLMEMTKQQVEVNGNWQDSKNWIKVSQKSKFKMYKGKIFNRKKENEKIRESDKKKRQRQSN